MGFSKEVKALIYKEMLLEWKQKFALNGLLLYSLSMVFVISIGLQESISPGTWNVIFWIILLFVSVNAIAKSFMGESSGQLTYLYTIAGPRAIITAKLIYNCLLIGSISVITLFFFLFFSGRSDIADLLQFVVVSVTGSFAFASNLTLVSAIASKARNKSTLLAVLSFPLVIPQMLVSISAGSKAMSGLPWSESIGQIIFSVSFVLIIAAVSVILFPFLWRE